MAAVARLCRPTFQDGLPWLIERKNPSPLVDRLQRRSANLIAADRDGNLRTIDWTDHEARMLLDRYYGRGGGHTLEAARDPGGPTPRHARHFEGDLGVLTSCRSRPGTPFQRVYGGAAQDPPRLTIATPAGRRTGKPMVMRRRLPARTRSARVVPCHRVIGSDGT